MLDLVRRRTAMDGWAGREVHPRCPTRVPSPANCDNAQALAGCGSSQWVRRAMLVGPSTSMVVGEPTHVHEESQMPDPVFLSDRIEVPRLIPAPPAAIFDILRSPAGH